jgi:hypothetical protein
MPEQENGQISDLRRGLWANARQEVDATVTDFRR